VRCVVDLMRSLTTCHGCVYWEHEGFSDCVTPSNDLGNVLGPDL
jgi:hypothetical protein